MNRLTSSNPMIRLADCNRWPIVSTLVPETLWENGIGNLFISRRAPNGMLIVGCFLVDTYCLGVKNATWMECSDGKLAERLAHVEEVGEKMRTVKPEYFAKLVLDSVKYAESFGLPPHVDFRTARLLIDGIDATLCDTQFEFGRDGKPYFVQGPNDSPEKIRLIMSRITTVGGHFLVGGEQTRLSDFDDIFDAESIDDDMKV